MKSVNGKRALITGASRGIGPYIASELATAGCNLVLTARSEDKLQEVAKSIAGNNIQIEIIPSDMANKDSLRQLVGAASENGQPIDILVNNAGIYEYGHFETIKFE